MSRSTSASASAPTATVNLARSLSLKTTSAPTKPSNVTLFITNLRLVDLDLRPDWPSITSQTFATQNAQQNQKNRIRCAEWALFRLFELWDAEETRDKLQPFFPPLEPLQSLNLRAALYRSLNELKKNGVFGRDCVLRKTMLDECKGDKFMEILVLFSTAVLKKTIDVRKQKGRQKPVVRTIATANVLSANQQSSLLPLAIAHKSALRAILQKKEEQRSRYTHFSERLDAKIRSIHQRNEQFNATTQKEGLSVQHADAISIKRQLRSNWIGNTAWLDIILHGNEQAEDGYLNAPFRDVWSTIQRGGSLQEGAQNNGLLETLELRVEQQRMRLQRWQAFHAKITETGMSSSRQTSRAVTKSVIPAETYDFSAHLDLQPGTLKSAQQDILKKSAESKLKAPQKYKDMVTEMREDISRVLQQRHDRTAALQTYTRRNSLYYSPQSPIRRKKSSSESVPKKTSELHSVEELSYTEEAPLAKKIEKPIFYTKSRSLSTPIDSEATLIGNSAGSLSLTSSPPVSNEVMCHEEEEAQLENFGDEQEVLEMFRSATYPELQARPDLSIEEHLAEQIISSIGEATPSPVKKPRPSLMERTRMSMAHSNALQIPETLEESPPAVVPSLPEIAEQPELDRRASLLERTRQSMSRISQQPSQKSRKSTVPKSRQSLFPVNQFETPRKQSPIEEKKGDSTPKEYLFSDHADYDHVFKSRPKIAQSPVFTPQHDEELSIAENLLDIDDSIIAEEGLMSLVTSF
ncbi:hypothetical protein AOQ84DRAFT_157239 [Glonium stellatum]|uniref:HAUS augmin-like complex subunit 6 N-terminal domain-containing protein n=1 Tax=Glonium stellatum TaxID=574774 RepID=A0A8E2JNG6_9PEZI|nr:hypothetical protein AOQ84DRAFT_157239 [Glonium stellatum]